MARRPKWWRENVTVASDVGPGQFVTQYGTTWFRDAPRFDEGESDISMCLGRRTADEAARMVTRRPAGPDARARVFRVSDLRAAGYVVRLTPTPLNPGHVSILAPGEPGDRLAWWSRPERVTLAVLAIEILER